MSKHIHDFTIHDYKGIHELKLSNLNAINILTGDNNSGKTSVLELISTVHNPHETGAWILSSRMRNTYSTKRIFFNGFYNMFPIDKEDKVISYDYTDAYDNKTNVLLKADFERTQVTESEVLEINGLKKINSNKDDTLEFIETTCMHLNTFVNQKRVNYDRIYDFQNKISAFNNKKSSFVTTTYISPVDHTLDVYFLNPILSNPVLYEELINMLKEFDDSIVSVTALKGDNTIFSSNEYMILSKKHDYALPLSAYGDGMKKAIFILNSLVRAQNGILLIDEFETGIHTSAMDATFSWLLKTALKLNVQVFLTSHSKEAIEKILNSCDELQPQINLYTLYNYNGNNYVRMMNCREAINAKDNLGLELR